MARLPVLLIAYLIFTSETAGQDSGPSPLDLIARFEKEKSPVWADGDIATFFYRGDVENVVLLVAGDSKQMKRLPDSDVWTATYKKPGLAKGVFTYVILPGKKGESYYGRKLPVQSWRGPQAPPAVTRTKTEELKGQVKTVAFESKALGAKREVHVYLPPGHDLKKSYPVLYGTDGQESGGIIEPLIVAGKIPPMVVVAPVSGGYLGERAALGTKADMSRDLRSMEYIPDLDKERYAKHEQFYCEELIPWAEREFGASRDRAQRGVTGCSNGGQFVLDMGVKHADLFAHVFAFSKAGHPQFRLPDPKPATLPTFHLAAGEWEPFYRGTQTVVAELKKKDVAHTFVSRVAGHDSTMWDEELAAALIRAWGATAKESEKPANPPSNTTK